MNSYFGGVWGVWATTNRLLIALGIFAATLTVPIGDADATNSSITLSVSSASVAPGSQVVYSAAMPVVGAGTVSQEIIQNIDPTKTKLTAIGDIAYPSGWTLSFSTDGTNFTPTAPTTSAGWSSIRAVKATGSLATEGAFNGKQIAQKTVNASTVNTAPAAVSSSGTGDGFQAFFDPGRTRVFNVYHHSGVGANLDCHVIATGATGSGFPFSFGGQTQEAAYGTVVGTKIWLPTNFNGLGGLPTGTGMRCVDIASVLSSGGAPRMCSTPYVSFGSVNAFPTHFSGGSTAGLSNETKLYLLHSTSATALVYCLDTATMAACSTSTLTPGVAGNSWSALDSSDILKSGDLIYVSVVDDSANAVRLSCLVASTGSLCPGWTAGRVVITKSGSAGYQLGGRFFELPNAAGGTRGVCYQAPTVVADKCWTSDGTEFAASTYNVPRFTNFQTANNYGSPVRQGTRVFYGNSKYGADSGAEIWCYDATVNSGAGGRCNGATTSIVQQHYTVTPDPSIKNCLWVTRHNQPVLKTFNILTGAEGCGDIAPQRAMMAGQTAVPRMGCSASDAIASWRNFILDAPTTGFTSATLSIQTGAGSDIQGWTNLALTPGVPLDLSGLSVTDSGQLPNFIVDFIGASGSLAPSARLSAVGDAPELCLQLLPVVICPSGSGALSSLSGTTTTPSASGSSTDSSNNVTTLSPDSATVTITAPSNAQCGATLSGSATANGTTLSIANATVTLLDSSGTPVLDGLGNQITTSTAADGTYSFGYLFPGGYKVRFSDVGVKTISSTTVTSGGSGTTSDNTAATSLLSNLSTLAVGVNGVVNATYYTPTIATADTSTGVQGAVQTINVKANDTASAGANITSPTIKFCSVDSPASGCTLTTKTVAGQGVYSLSAGNVLFTPCSATNTPANASCTGAFTGTATSVSYQITDSSGSSATSTITPTVVPPPTATADAQTGAWDTNQSYSPHQNDTAGAGTTLATSPAGICLNTVTVASSCTSTTLTILNQGTYTLNTGTGVVTFDPLPTFAGTATSIKYASTDALSQKTLSTITPTVQPPPPPTANADSTIGKVGQAQTVNPFANDTVGASGITFTASSVKLCSTGQTSPNCTATSLAKAGEGNYSVNAVSGVVTFTPCSALNTPAGASCTGEFTGSATSVAYQVGTSFGDVASSTYTPKVVPLPTATPEVESGAWNTNQVYMPTSNDTAGSGASLVAVPSGICLNTVTVASSCTSSSLTIANQGTYVLDTNTGSVTFDPLPSFTGTATPIKYAVADSLGQQSLSTITPTVSFPNAPTATPESKTVIPGSSVSFTTLTGAGALASTGGPLFNTAATCLVDSSVTPHTCGTTLSVAGEGTWSVNTVTGIVTFLASQSVTAGTKTTVTYRVTDETGQVATSTLTPIVPPSPSVNPDSSVDEQLETQVLSPLSNDSVDLSTTIDVSSLKLCPSNATSPFNGTNCNLSSLSITDVGKYTVNASGTVSFVPCTAVAGVACAGSYLGGSSIFTGTSTVRYVVADQVGQYGSSTLEVEVLPPPVVKPVNDSGTSPFDTPIVFEPLSNDSGGTTSGLSGYTSTGAATLNESTLKLCDAGQRAPSCSATSITTPEGEYVLDPLTNRITFTPATNFVGTPVGPPQYMVCNQIGGSWTPVAPSTTCAVAKVTPTIQPPLSPVAGNDAPIGPYNTPIVISVLDNDFKDAALTIAPSSVKLCVPGNGQAPPACTGTTIQVPGEGTYTVNPVNGQVTFTPLPSFSGVVTYTPAYQFTDSFGSVGSALITPNILPPPAPYATSQSRPVLPGASVEFSNVVGTSIITSGTGLKTGAVGGPCLIDPTDNTCKSSFNIAGEGRWSIDQMTGVPTFVADVTATDGSKTPVAYQVTDVVGQTASAFLTPVIPGLSTVVADSGSAGLDTNQTFDVVANDISGSLTVLVLSTVRLCATGQSSPNCTATTLSVSGEGTYSVDSSGIVTFDPDPLFVGQATPISYQVNDLMDRSFSTTITPTVTSVPPTATPDTIVIVAGGSRSFDPIFGAGGLVTRNVGGTALDPTTVCIVDPVTTICGVSSVVAVGEGTYSLDVNTGVVTFTAEAGVRPGQLTPLVYKMSDLSGHVVESTLTPTILGPLVLHADASADVQSAVQILRPLVNDDPGSLNFPLVPSTLRLCAPTDTPPVCSQTTLQVEGEGTYVVNTATGEITFTPLENFTGSATPISYVVEDSYGQRQSSEIAVVVRASSSSVPGGSASGSGNNQSGNSSQPTNSEGGKIPTTGRNTSELVGLLLVVVALGIVFSRAARRRNYSC